MESIDFLPKDFPAGLRIFVYVLIVLHVLAFAYWCVIAIPTIFKKKETFADRVDKMFKDKQKKN